MRIIWHHARRFDRKPRGFITALAIRIAIEPPAFLLEPVTEDHHLPYPLDALFGRHLEQGPFQMPVHPLIMATRRCRVRGAVRAAETSR